MAKTKIGGLEKEVARILEDYSESVGDIVKREIDVSAKEGVKKLKETSPRQEKNSSGYYKSWRSKAVGETSRHKEVVIYSTKPGMPHLLENGHLTRSGSRTKAIPHIKPVEEEVKRSLEERIVRGIGNA